MQDLETSAALTEHEIQVLISIMSTRGKCTITNLDEDMAKAKFTRLATSIAIKSLSQEHMMINTLSLCEDDSFDNEYAVFELTSKGVDWIMENQQNLPLKIEDNQSDDFPPY